MKDYYKILKVNKNATREEIDNAYSELARNYDSDIDSEKIKELKEAYKVLANDFFREQYDSEIEKIEEKNRNEKEFENKVKKEENIKDKKAQNNDQSRYKKRTRKQPRHERKTEKTYKVGSFGSLVELTKQVFSIRPKKREKKEITREDIIAVVLTIIIVVIIGIILWYIPFTNGWMRELLFENPIFNWIGKIFS